MTWMRTEWVRHEDECDVRAEAHGNFSSARALSRRWRRRIFFGHSQMEAPRAGASRAASSSSCAAWWPCRSGGIPW
jgi:hypothetical protein